MEGKLETLKQLVADMFKQAEDKQSIEQLSKINNSISEVEQEQKALVDKNAELIKSYKDLIQHTSFKDSGTSPMDQVGGSPVTFEEALSKFVEKKGN